MSNGNPDMWDLRDYTIQPNDIDPMQSHQGDHLQQGCYYRMVEALYGLSGTLHWKQPTKTLQHCTDPVYFVRNRKPFVPRRPTNQERVVK